MPKYLLKASYSPEGTQGLLKEGGSNRRDAATKAIENVGGTVECFYYAFGDRDAYVIMDMPDDIAAAAVGLKVASSGLVSVATTPLLTPEQIDAACDKGTTLVYRPPGA